VYYDGKNYEAFHSDMESIKLSIPTVEQIKEDFENQQNAKDSRYGYSFKKARQVDIISGICESCGKSEISLMCSGCYKVFYCNNKCQKLDYLDHKHVCK